MSSGTAHINSFPSEVLLHIFSYLPTSDLVVCATKVCARWNAVAFGRKLWLRRKVDLPGDTSVRALVKCFPKCPSVSMVLNTMDTRPGRASVYDDYLHADIRTRECFLSFLTTIIKNGDAITHISVTGINSGVEEVLKIISHLPNLQSLDMHESFATDNSGIGHLADKCPHLKEVHTREMTFSEEEVKYFVKKKKHQLTHISFSLQMGKGPSLLPYLAVCGDTLISLDVYGTEGSCSPSVSGASVFRALKKLEHLTFHNAIKFRNGVLAKAFTSGWFSNLRTLSMVTAYYVDDRVMVAICLNCPLLTDLSINKSEVTGEGLKYLHCLRNLQSLDLSSSDCLRSLGALSQCVQLQQLDLARCMFISAREIADTVPHLRELRHLDLSICEVSQLCLAELPQQLPLLRSLFLYLATVDEEQVEAMKLYAPHIHVLREF